MSPGAIVTGDEQICDRDIIFDLSALDSTLLTLPLFCTIVLQPTAQSHGTVTSTAADDLYGRYSRPHITCPKHIVTPCVTPKQPLLKFLETKKNKKNE